MAASTPVGITKTCPWNKQENVKIHMQRESNISKLERTEATNDPQRRHVGGATQKPHAVPATLGQVSYPMMIPKVVNEHPLHASSSNNDNAAATE